MYGQVILQIYLTKFIIFYKLEPVKMIILDFHLYFKLFLKDFILYFKMINLVLIDYFLFTKFYLLLNFVIK